MVGYTVCMLFFTRSIPFGPFVPCWFAVYARYRAAIIAAIMLNENERREFFLHRAVTMSLDVLRNFFLVFL